MKSVMKHNFSQIPKANIQRSSFNRSHGYKTTFDSGALVPVYVDEALPGDTFNLNLTTFARLGTPLVPVMDNMFLDTFFFAVPYRLVWSNWQKFNGEQANPADSTDYLIPQMTAPVGGYANMSLSDYMGLPTQVAGYDHSSLYHRAYNLIYNEWFRDQNLQDSVVVDIDDGPDLDTDYTLLTRGKRHDYFTSCLPWPQKGPAVELPIGDTAPITGIGVGPNYNFSRAAVGSIHESNANIETYAKAGGTSPMDLDIILEEDPSNVGYPFIQADLSAATASTINALRQAFQIQRLYEKDARGGTRYTEIIRSHFSVTSDDARLQRPEYLGGGNQSINITPVVNQSGTGTLGELAATGVSTSSRHGFTKSFTEHCLLIGLVNVRADLTYQQGLDRKFSRLTRWDFYWPTLAHLGEQAVLNKEIYLDATANDELVFGYQERFAEYRYAQSKITGKFRSNDATSLDFWHLSQDFASLPLLNDTFISEDVPIDRVIATPTEPQFLLDCYFDIKCARPMPVYSVPGLIDHF
jgi:hypothetical protein